MQVGWQVLSTQSEHQRIEGYYRAEIRGASEAEAEEDRQQRLVASFQEQLMQHQREVSSLDAKLDKARKEVSQLENQRAARVKEAEEAGQAVAQTQGKLAALAAEVRRRRENASVRH